MAPETTHAEQRGTTAEAGETTGVALDGRRQSVAGASDAHDWRRAARTERALLQLRIDALERTVEHKDRRLQAVVDQYEQVLTERDRTRRAERNETVDEVEIEFEDDRSESRLERATRRVRAVLDRFRR
jgi:hypothetical protein